MLPLAVATLASWVVPMNLGMIVAARMPMTMTTTMISTRVKAPCLFLIVRMFMLFLFLEGRTHAEDGQQNRNDHEANHASDHHDQGRREQGNHGFGARPHGAIL